MAVVHDGVLTGSAHGTAAARAKKSEAAWHTQDLLGLREGQERRLRG